MQDDLQIPHVKVEDVLFRVPKLYFKHNSSVFNDMFTLPSGDSEIEGSSDEKPIILEGIQCGDFQRLLQVMYPSSVNLYYLHS